MASASITSRRTARGETPALDRQGRGFAARRTLLVVALLTLLVVVAVTANYGPVSHYLQARERLQETTARVAALEERTAALKTQLGKLSETGHLEDLARQQLTYALPGEELYIVGGADAETDQGAAIDTGDTSAASGAASEGAPTVQAATAAGVGGRDASPTQQAAAPGFFESILMKLASLF